MHGPNIAHIYPTGVAEINLIEGWIRMHVQHTLQVNGLVVPAIPNTVTVKFSDTTPPINPNASFANVIITKAKEYIEGLDNH